MSAIADTIRADLREIYRLSMPFPRIQELVNRVGNNVDLIVAADDDSRSQAKDANRKLDERIAEYEQKLKR